MSAPIVSFGLPVRNGAKYVAQAVESVLDQTVADLELVITDNASTDGTSEICQSFAKRDSRVRHLRNDEDIGRVANFCRAFRVSVAPHFKWLGVDDNLLPEYAEELIAALRRNDDAVLAFSYEKHTDDAGNTYLYDYDAFKVTSRRPWIRLHHLLMGYDLHRRRAGYNIDPIYSLMRRSALERTSLFHSIIDTHIALAAELSLQGAFVQVPRVLVHRRQFWPGAAGVTGRQLLVDFDPRRARLPRSNLAAPVDLRRLLLANLARADIRWWERLPARCSIYLHHVILITPRLIRRGRSLLFRRAPFRWIKQLVRRSH